MKYKANPMSVSLERLRENYIDAYHHDAENNPFERCSRNAAKLVAYAVALEKTLEPYSSLDGTLKTDEYPYYLSEYFKYSKENKQAYLDQLESTKWKK